MDDSAMIMRVKYKTVPGGQFVIRREVYRMIQESFRENGIEFAHRDVTVYLPPGEDTGDHDKKSIQAGAAAAAAAAAQAEAAKETPK
jgi:small-conductance mechanosensitive channel